MSRSVRGTFRPHLGQRHLALIRNSTDRFVSLRFEILENRVRPRRGPFEFHCADMHINLRLLVDSGIAEGLLEFLHRGKLSLLLDDAVAFDQNISICLWGRACSIYDVSAGNEDRFQRFLLFPISRNATYI